MANHTSSPRVSYFALPPKLAAAGDRSLMLCPSCGFEYSHHVRVDGWTRFQEDWPSSDCQYIRGFCNAESIAADYHTDFNLIESANPSPRRDGIVIWFQGECGHVWGLRIAQHKGETFIDTILAHIESEVEHLRTMPYDEYLRTDHWQDVREGALERAGYRCQLCNSSETLSVHHRTYERRGCEEPGDVTVLCRSCHAKFHSKLIQGRHS